jgi:hypothetical protein
MPPVRDATMKACVQVAVKRQHEILPEDAYLCREDILYRAFPVLDVPEGDGLGQQMGGQMPFYDFIADDEKKKDRKRRRFAAPVIDPAATHFETVGVRTLYMDSRHLGAALEKFRRLEKHHRDTSDEDEVSERKSKRKLRQALRSIYVEKAGHIQANGRYIYVGHQNGAPCYMKGAWKLSREVLGGKLSWVLGRVPVPYYAVVSDEILPPANKWLCHNDVQYLHGIFSCPRLHSRSKGLRAKLHAMHRKHHHAGKSLVKG